MIDIRMTPAPDHQFTESVVKACSKGSPAASKVLLGRWRIRDVSSLRENRAESLQDIPSRAAGFCFDASDSSSRSRIAFKIDVSVICAIQHLLVNPIP